MKNLEWESSLAGGVKELGIAIDIAEWIVL